MSSLARDVSELLPDLVPALRGRLNKPAGPVAYHPPCTLQHGQKLRGGVEALDRVGMARRGDPRRSLPGRPHRPLLQLAQEGERHDQDA